MNILLPPRRGAVEKSTSVFCKLSCLKNQFLCSSWTQWSITNITKLLLLLVPKYLLLLLHTATRRTLDNISIFSSIFILTLLSCHFVCAVNDSAHQQLENSNQSSTSVDNSKNNSRSDVDPDGSRHTRYAGANISKPSSSMILRPEFFFIPIGGVLHLFPRYGYLSLSMKVIAKNGTSSAVQNDTWMFLEPINNVIEPTTLKVAETKFSSPSSTNQTQGSLPFHNLFHFDLCEDVRALMEAYFKNFSVEGLDKPWQAWAGGWRAASIARYFGIEQYFVEGDYRFVLVKVLLVRGTGTVQDVDHATVASGYTTNFQRFEPNNELSTYEFFKVVGTHYIHSYITGNAIYQVFVYDPDGFQAVKRRLFYDGIKDESTGSAEPILESLTMWVKHVGQVGVLNANAEITESVRKALIMHNTLSPPTPNLLKLHDNANLVKEVESLLSSQPNGILGIDLRGIHFLFSDPVQRAGFEQALKHKMQLWEINFLY